MMLITHAKKIGQRIYSIKSPTFPSAKRYAQFHNVKKNNKLLDG